MRNSISGLSIDAVPGRSGQARSLVGALGRLLACAVVLLGPLAPAAAEQLPAWVANPPADTSEAIYGVGDGLSLPASQKDALRAIAGKLSTAVQSNTTSQARRSGQQVTRQFQQNIQTQIQKTKLTNYSIVETAPHASGFYTLVKMSRPAFIRSTKLRLKELDQSITDLAAGAERQSKLRRFVAYRTIHSKAQEATGLVYLLQAADHGYDGNGALQKYRRYNATARKLSSQVRLLVRAQHELTPLAEELAQFLADAGIATTDRKPADGVLEVRGHIRKGEVFSSKMVKLDVEFVTMEANGSVIKRHPYHLSGSSVTSYDEAIRKAAAKLKKQDGTKILTDIGLQ